MPELPEVETIVNDLRPLLEGRRILRVELLLPKAVETPSPEEFPRAIEGR
ncbi:TPA: formamidopyrimidine-DNA glycosylase, partial [Candidatus Bipolaricaulota bacterium]|nr:formamidopyrimidine-DNA glycosylase [Candidatus Bipolaricaulota bacterium]